MKIILSKFFYEFPPRLLAAYLEEKGIPYYVYAQDSQDDIYYRADLSLENFHEEAVIYLEDFGDSFSQEDKMPPYEPSLQNNAYTFDKTLIGVFEKYKDEFEEIGDYLEVVEIPDGRKFVIKEEQDPYEDIEYEVIVFEDEIEWVKS